MITGDAEMAAAGSGKKITIGAGPWRGEYLPEQAVGLITSRYLLQARDGAVGTTGEGFREMISSIEARDSQIVNDNIGRVFIKIRALTYLTDRSVFARLAVWTRDTRGLLPTRFFTSRTSTTAERL